MVQQAAKHLIQGHPADLIVTTHPFANTFALKALGKDRPPFITVVTDMVTTHAFWFDKRADLILVPTETARQRAVHYHMSPEKIRVVGLPVADRNYAPAEDKPILRERLGWPADKPVVLMVGGGEGMGPLEAMAQAVDESGLDVALALVAGRNLRLKARLEEQVWGNPVFVYGFTREMPELMRAADFIVTKAGPGTMAMAPVALSVSSNASATVNPTTVTVSNLFGLAPGQVVTGTGIPLGAYIVAIDPGTSSYTLSAPVTGQRTGSGMPGNVNVSCRGVCRS